VPHRHIIHYTFFCDSVLYSDDETSNIRVCIYSALIATATSLPAKNSISVLVLMIFMFSDNNQTSAAKTTCIILFEFFSIYWKHQKHTEAVFGKKFPTITKLFYFVLLQIGNIKTT
jgi:hypothetical protein